MAVRPLRYSGRAMRARENTATEQHQQTATEQHRTTQTLTTLATAVQTVPHSSVFLCVLLSPFRVLLWPLFLLTFLLSPWSALAAVQARPQQPAVATAAPRVRLIATGGTISNKLGGRLTADELVALMPDVLRWARP